MIDAWMQHPTGAFLRHEMFEPLRRWMGAAMVPDAIPLEVTLAAMDAAGLDMGVLCAWWGPEGALLSNDEVAATVRAAPDRFVGLASVDLRRPMRPRCSASVRVAERHDSLRPAGGFHGPRTRRSRHRR